MRLFIDSKKRLALLFAIVLAVFSTGMVIAHQCNSVFSDHDSLSTVMTNPLNVPLNGANQLINSGCVALFIVVLLMSRKYFNFGTSRSRLKSFVVSGRELVVSFQPQVFHLALSRPQLGVIRV